MTVYDPLYFKGSGREHLAKELHAVTWASSTDEALSGANGVCILTEWPEFTDLKLGEIQNIMLTNPLLADFRNLYNAELASNFDYLSLGRSDVLRT